MKVHDYVLKYAQTTTVLRNRDICPKCGSKNVITVDFEHENIVGNLVWSQRDICPNCKPLDYWFALYGEVDDILSGHSDHNQLTEILSLMTNVNDAFYRYIADLEVFATEQQTKK